MAVALDSSAVIAFLDRSDAFHEAADGAIRGHLAGGETLQCSAVTFAEVLTGAKLGHHDEDLVRGFFRELIAEITPVDAAVADRAAELRSAEKALRMPDALILAGADFHPDTNLLVCADEAAQKAARLLSCSVQTLAPATG